MPKWSKSAGITFSQKCNHCITAITIEVSWWMILCSIKSPQIQNSVFPTSSMKTACYKWCFVNTDNISVSWKISINLLIWPCYLIPTPFAFHSIEYYPARLLVGAIRLQPDSVISLKEVYQSASQLHSSEALWSADLMHADALCHTGRCRRCTIHY